MANRPLRVLAIEPFYGGSHQAFLDGWIQRSRHDWTLLTYSAHHWKWRMRHAPCSAAAQVRRWLKKGQTWDLVFCSDMLNLAEFRGLCPRQVSELPSVCYFHENQLTYPVRNPSERDFHFVVSNFYSALAASQIWFNSQFHQDEFLGALPEFWSQLPDHRPLDEVARLSEKSRVESPGIDWEGIRSGERPDRALDGEPTGSAASQAAPLITWAARWEFDKNPEAFFAALEHECLAERRWRLSVLGQSFRQTPACFNDARSRWSERILHWGFQADRASYHAALAESEIFVSTANHEFFGIGVVEAIAAGCLPLLPNRLAYPEILSVAKAKELRLCFYEHDRDLPRALTALLDAPNRSELQESAAEQIRRFQWPRRAEQMDRAIEQLVGQ